jgi:hypothetical protein
MLGRTTAAATIVSYCSKCRKGLEHVIVAKEGAEVTKVKCGICGCSHKHRDPATVKPRAPRKKAPPTIGVLWSAYMTQAQARGRELTYNITGRYRVGDILVHDKFGKGVVRKLATNRCHVVFQDKERLMASAN